MPRKPKETIITPEIQIVLDRWLLFAVQNNICLSPYTDTRFKAKVVAESNRCPCDYKRLSCPCELCLGEIAVSGQCFCHVFCSLQYINSHKS